MDKVADTLYALGGKQISAYPSLALGAVNMSPMEVASIYQSFSANGFHSPLRSVTAVLDKERKPLERYSLEVGINVKPEAVALINSALIDVTKYGTAKNLSKNLDLQVAGKTGTSDDLRDSWFAGFDNTHLAVVWVGNDDYSETGLTGATGALAVWDEVMNQLGVEPLAEPTRELASVEYSSGLRAHADCAEVVEIPIPQGTPLQHKAGCGITLRSVSERIRKWLQ